MLSYGRSETCLGFKTEWFELEPPLLIDQIRQVMQYNIYHRRDSGQIRKSFPKHTVASWIFLLRNKRS